MTALETPMIPVDKIVVEDGLNARKSMDQEALKRLGKSIAKDELVQPITVRPIEDGKFALIAGERRYEAAKLEGIEKLPAHIVTSGNRRTISFIENLHREDLNKIEEAEGLEDLAKELKLSSSKALAKEVGMSQAWVSSRRRLLRLPEKVQQAIAREEMPIDGVPLLLKVAAVSPRIAERLCEVYKTDEAFSDFVRDFTDMLYSVADEEVEDRPTMIDPDRVTPLRVENRFPGPVGVSVDASEFGIAFGTKPVDVALGDGRVQVVGLRLLQLRQDEPKTGRGQASIAANE